MVKSDENSPHLFSSIGRPDYSFEQGLLSNGYQTVCGVDEAGRGPLAGPVTAAAVILDPDNIPNGLDDSKKLSEKRRAELYEAILQYATVAVSHVSAATIDSINIRSASLRAMTFSVNALSICPDHALIDGNALPLGLKCSATALVKGDARSLSIAAASIVAKVSRDRLMFNAERHYPEYGFSGHKGYPTKSHREIVATVGPCALHRKTFAPVATALAKSSITNSRE